MLIALDGNIACGKSTLLRLLSSRVAEIDSVRYGSRIDPEPIEAWDSWLGRLYDRNYVTGAIEFQLRVWQDRCASPPPSSSAAICFVERSPFFHQNTFLLVQHALGNITDAGALLLHQLYDQHTAWRPDLYVYLRSKPAVCQQRIAQRGRRYEEHMPLEYLQRVHERHDAAAEQLQHQGAALLVVEGDGTSLELVSDNIWAVACQALEQQLQSQDPPPSFVQRCLSTIQGQRV